MKVVEMGGAQEILNVLEGAKDAKTRKEALKALVALAKSGEEKTLAIPIDASYLILVPCIVLVSKVVHLNFILVLCR